MLRRLITLAILLAVAAGLAWAFWPRPLPVETAAIAARDISVTVEEEGKDPHPRGLHRLGSHHRAGDAHQSSPR
jgi:hypothetical protein